MQRRADLSLPQPSPHDPVVVTAAGAEELAPLGHYLLAGSTDIGGRAPAVKRGDS
ncbi:hypothetical protein [Amycolatopsis anabasis]|uniref:hypothetical protein n=1 Tax=Amycolatopsis anabasis TaxID=1840409 RepID=UPI00131DC02B|nr:hypothetical protein [Amycolatopsis anabasis]